MNRFSELDSLLRNQDIESADRREAERIYGYARCMADIEGVVAVVSDIHAGSSRIFNGHFAAVLGIEGYSSEESIWEKRILSLMPPAEQEAKFLAELRFLNYTRSLGKNRRHHCLMTKLRFADGRGGFTDVMHRMYYIHDDATGAVRYAICLYGPLTVDFKGKSIVANTLTGLCEELTSDRDSSILSPRERQVLSLINSGMKSREIAAMLNISVYTVSRHRQSILERLQVKNSVEACRRAAILGLV